MSETDAEYVARCLDGWPEAFRGLVERHQATVLSYLTGRLGDPEQAEEAAQECFVRAYFGLRKLKSPPSFFSWLLGIAARVAKEMQRSRRRDRDIAAAAARSTSDAGSGPDLPLERAVAELPEAYREVVLLRYYGELTCAQVGERLGVPLGTVTKRLSRAYALLRETLGRHGSPGQRQEAES